MSDEEYFRSCVARERHLAQLLGHHNLEECYESAGILWENNDALPQWTRDWNACAPLMVKYGIAIHFGKEADAADTSFVTAGSTVVHFSDHPSHERAVMYAIVKASISLLEHSKGGKHGDA
jgi:hypothetical protein